MKTFVIIEPSKEVCQFMVEILARFLRDRAEVVDFVSFDKALEEIMSIKEVAMVFVAFNAPTERGPHIARHIKKALPSAKVILTSTFDAKEEAVKFDLDDFVTKIEFATIGRIHQLMEKHGIEL